MTSRSNEAQIDQICDSFEAQWQSGEQPVIKDSLESVAESDRPALLRELVFVDIEYRLRRGDPDVKLNNYVETFGLEPEDISILRTGSTVKLTGAADLEKPPSSRYIGRGSRFGDHEILAPLGHGGMGVVYRARHLTLNRIVALKTLPAGLDSSKESIERFRAEAEANAQLNHHGIVPILELGETDGVPWFTMPLIEGNSLTSVLEQRQMSNREIAKLISEAADALDFAHQHGVIHRDVKPGNVLITPDGTPRILDFGLAHLNSRDEQLTHTGDILGTVAYMSPEQAVGDHLWTGPKADIYSLGATMYRCLTGRAPFQGPTSVETLRQVVEEPPIDLRRSNAEVDRDLETICLRCLAKSPDRRFPTAHELAEELRRYLNGEPIRSRRAGTTERFVRWARRRPFAALTALLSMVLLLLLSIGVPFAVIQQTQRRQAEQLATAHAARAATQQYYAGVNEVREYRRKQTPGWSWDALGKLKEITHLDAEGRNPTELRSLIASIENATDARELAPFATQIRIDRMADKEGPCRPVLLHTLLMSASERSPLSMLGGFRGHWRRTQILAENGPRPRSLVPAGGPGSRRCRSGIHAGRGIPVLSVRRRARPADPEFQRASTALPRLRREMIHRPLRMRKTQEPDEFSNFREPAVSTFLKGTDFPATCIRLPWVIKTISAVSHSDRLLPNLQHAYSENQNVFCTGTHHDEQPTETPHRLHVD